MGYTGVGNFFNGILVSRSVSYNSDSKIVIQYKRLELSCALEPVIDRDVGNSQRKMVTLTVTVLGE